MSSHTLRIPDNAPSSTIFVQLIREPAARLTAAWRHLVTFEGSNDFIFSKFLLNHAYSRNLQCQFCFGYDLNQIDNFSLTDRIDEFKISHRPNVFLGVVERYDESMTALEFVLQQMRIEIDLSYPTAINVANGDNKKLILDVQIPENFVNLDRKLHEVANDRLDYTISLISDFKDRLHDFRTRCHQFRETPEDFHSRLEHKYWLYI